MKPKKLAADRIARWAREGQGNLVWVEANVAQIVQANDWMNDGLSGTDYSAVRRGGNDGSSVERAALAQSRDDIAITAMQFLDALTEARRLLYVARTKGEKLIADWSDDERRLAAEFTARRDAAPGVSSDRCKNCGRVVAGTAKDPLRSGRCDACRKYRERNNEERPRALWGGDSVDPVCPNILTHHGIDYRCPLDAGHDGDCDFPFRASA